MGHETALLGTSASLLPLLNTLPPHSSLDMRPIVHSPQPVRPPKRSLNRIDPASDRPSASKHPRLASPPLLLPSPDPSDDKDISLHARRPSDCPSWTPSKPAHKRKRALEDPPGYASLKRQRVLRSSPSPFTSSVFRWLSEVPRPQSPPPCLLSTETCASLVELVELIERPSSAPARFGMSQSCGQRPASVTSTQNTRPGTSDPLYRSLIHCNHIILDPSGREIEDDIRELLDTHILKGRDSPPLTDVEVFEVVDTAVDLMNSAEGKASDIIGTKAFPMKRRRIAEGRNVQWSTNALPSNPKYPHQLSAPKPDRHYGYPLGQMSEWTVEEMAVVDHRTAQPYAQPTRENLFPFLMFEIKSEATGGVLYAAENQAVGSGVHSVSSLRWLLEQAFPTEVPKAADAVAFTGAISPRAAVFYIVWFSERRRRYIMSNFGNVCFMNGPKRPDIQQCRNVMENVLDYGLDVRQATIREALARLDPTPPHWKKSRSTSDITETPATSFITEDKRPNKSQKS